MSTTTKELSKAASTNARGNHDDKDLTPLADEAIRASIGLLTTGIDVARATAANVVNVADTMVMGTLQVAQEWTKAGPWQQLAEPALDMARQTWTAGRSGAEQLLAAL
jgi:hypothetical protein